MRFNDRAVRAYGSIKCMMNENDANERQDIFAVDQQRVCTQVIVVDLILGASNAAYPCGCVSDS